MSATRSPNSGNEYHEFSNTITDTIEVHATIQEISLLTIKHAYGSILPFSTPADNNTSPSNPSGKTTDALLKLQIIRISVILLSGLDEFEYARAALRLDVDEYLLKPLNDDELHAALEKIRVQLEETHSLVRLPADWSPESIQQFIADCFTETNREQNLLAQRAADFIAAHFAEPITQSDVAEALGITPAYLSGVFHEAKGESYTKFLTRLRMTQAALLLKSNPDLTIQTIAERTGYATDKHFISVFKKFFHVTPNEYRRL